MGKRREGFKHLYDCSAGGCQLKEYLLARTISAAAAATVAGVCRFRKPASSSGPYAPHAFNRVESCCFESGRDEKGTGGPDMMFSTCRKKSKPTILQGGRGNEGSSLHCSFYSEALLQSRDLPGMIEGQDGMLREAGEVGELLDTPTPRCCILTSVHYRCFDAPGGLCLAVGAANLRCTRNCRLKSKSNSKTSVVVAAQRQCY